MEEAELLKRKTILIKKIIELKGRIEELKSKGVPEAKIAPLKERLGSINTDCNDEEMLAKYVALVKKLEALVEKLEAEKKKKKEKEKTKSKSR